MVKNLLSISIPALVAIFSAVLIEVINLVFVGHMGDISIVGGVGLGNMYINIFCMSILQGLNSAMCTLVP